MKYITLTSHFKGFKLSTVISSESSSYYSHLLGMGINCISEYFIYFIWINIVPISEILWINNFMNKWKSMFWWPSSIQLKISLWVSSNINRELFDFLHIYEMEMDRMSIRSKIDQVKIIGFTSFKSAAGAFHSIHHGLTINEHGWHLSVFIKDFE